MVFRIDDRLLKLIAGPVRWFAEADSPSEFIRHHVPAGRQGVYCLWWKDPTQLPRAPLVELNAGRRGKRPAELSVHSHGLCDAAAMYVGKGQIRSRLLSHVKPAAGSERNPYWWVTQVVQDMEGGQAFRAHLGFSFVEEESVFEQVYAENLGIGVLRPWFNLRFAA